MSFELLLNAAEFLEQQENLVIRGSEKAAITPSPSPSESFRPVVRGSASLDDRLSPRKRGGVAPYPLVAPPTSHQHFTPSPMPPLVCSSSLSSSSSSSSSMAGDASSPLDSPLDSPSGVVMPLGNGVSPTNGFLRPNGLLPKALSPLARDLDDKDDPKKRSGTTPSREVHNKLEKNRRAHLKECFETLRRQLPSLDDKKISNQTILKAAYRDIQSLKRKEREDENEMERLARQKIAYQQQLSALKKELQSRWNHIDLAKILPDASTAQDLGRDHDTNSTATASVGTDDNEMDPKSPPPLSSFSQRHTIHSTTAPEHKKYSSGCLDLGGTLLGSDQPLNLSASASNPLRSSPARPLSSTVVGRTANGMASFGDKPSRMPPMSRGQVLVQNHHAATTQSLNTSINNNNRSIMNSTNGHLMTKGGSLRSLGTTKVVAPFPNLALSAAASSATAPVHHSQMSSQHYAMASTASMVTTPSTLAGMSTAHPVTHLTAVARLSPSVSRAGGKSASVAAEHTTTIPIMSSNGIQIPAQLVAAAGPATLLGQTAAIQVITPEGYKLLPAEHSPNGTAKPLAILTHSGLEHLSNGEDGKGMMVAVSKNGLSALHLTMPASGRSFSNSIVPVTSVPLNLTVGGSGHAMKGVQAGSASILPSYMPLPHSNGITQLVQGMSLVGPLVVSQGQRGMMIPAGAASVANTPKGVKSPLVPAQYANGLTSVVVVSASPAIQAGVPAGHTALVTSAPIGMHAAAKH